MLKNKIISVMVAVVMAVVMAFCLCACNGGNGQNEAPTPATEPKLQTEPPASTSGSGTLPKPSAPTSDIPLDVDSATTQMDAIPKHEAPTIASGEVVISLEYERQSGSASNQYAIWIEDMDGNYIQTLYASRWTANGGYKSRPDSIALWARKSDLAAMPKSDVDAISGATPRAGTQTYTWDLATNTGGMITTGEYRFFVEGTLRWKNYVLYSGVIEIGDKPVTVQASVDYFYESSDRYAALTGESPENNMITDVKATFVPNGF